MGTNYLRCMGVQNELSFKGVGPQKCELFLCMHLSQIFLVYLGGRGRCKEKPFWVIPLLNNYWPLLKGCSIKNILRCRDDTETFLLGIQTIINSVHDMIYYRVPCVGKYKSKSSFYRSVYMIKIQLKWGVKIGTIPTCQVIFNGTALTYN